MNTKLVYHIGFHKTGTTWLQNVLFKEKEIFNLINNSQRPWEDEFCRQIINHNQYDFNLQYCLTELEKRIKSDKVNVLSAERLSGHPMSGGYDVSQIAYRLYQINSKAKIIITIREPKSFITSAYKQMVHEGYCGRFEDFLSENQWKLCGPSKVYFLQHEIVEIYKNRFGEESVLTLNFDEFKNDKKSYLAKIQEFLNLEITIVNEESFSNIINSTYSNKRIKALKFLNRFRRTEINPFPLIDLNSKYVNGLSKLFSIFYSSDTLIDKAMLDRYIQTNNDFNTL
jgi:hypothetical protein